MAVATDVHYRKILFSQFYILEKVELSLSMFGSVAGAALEQAAGKLPSAKSLAAIRVFIVSLFIISVLPLTCSFCSPLLLASN